MKIIIHFEWGNLGANLTVNNVIEYSPAPVMMNGSV